MVVNFNSKVRDNNFLLIILSKNKKSINNFLFFFFKSIKTYTTVSKFFPIKTSTQKITILKSPHVNKTAQEQFESKKFNKKILLNSKCMKFYIIIIKNILNQIFQDLKITIKINQNFSNKGVLKVFNLYNFKLLKKKKTYFNQVLKKKKIEIKNNFYGEKKKKIANFTIFLKLFSLKGEILTTKN